MPLDNNLGGAGATPGSYTIQGQTPDLLVNPDGTTTDAVTIRATETIYGVPFEITVPRTVWQDAAVEAQAGAGPAGTDTALGVLVSEYAAEIQVLGELEPVVDIFYQRGQNRRGLFTDNLVVTVGTPDGNSSAEVTVPLDPNQANQINNTVLATYQNLLTVQGFS